MHAALAQLKAHLLRHVMVASIVFGMLLVPATCADAAGPHSLFLSPMAKHDSSMHHAGADDGETAMAMPGMSAEEHALHMLMGHATSSGGETETDTPAGSSPAIQGDAPAGDTGVSLTDLPSTMAMVAVSNPATIDELDAIQFPPSPIITPRMVLTLTGRTVSLELPPPRFA